MYYAFFGTHIDNKTLQDCRTLVFILSVPGPLDESSPLMSSSTASSVVSSKLNEINLWLDDTFVLLGGDIEIFGSFEQSFSATVE